MSIIIVTFQNSCILFHTFNLKHYLESTVCSFTFVDRQSLELFLTVGVNLISAFAVFILVFERKTLSVLVNKTLKSVPTKFININLKIRLFYLDTFFSDIL